MDNVLNTGYAQENNTPFVPERKMFQKSYWKMYNKIKEKLNYKRIHNKREHFIKSYFREQSQ